MLNLQALQLRVGVDVDVDVGSRCPTPPRHALLAESLGMPSL